MKKPIQDLIEEHGGIILMLKIMAKVAEKLRQGEGIDRRQLKKIVEFLRNFADKCHHGKEEGILFPELAKNESNRIIINELLGEHKTGRDYIRGISESIDGFQPGSPDAIHIAVNSEAYAGLLTEHIKKEHIFFETADKELSDDLQESIQKRFDKLEEEVIGEGKHEEYHGWLKELHQVFLS